MKELLLLVGAVTIALAIAGAAVLGGHDTTVFVPPPDAVAEDFARRLATGRYDRAVRDLHDQSDASARAVRAAGEELRRRAGSISQVEGERGVTGGTRATASALVETEQAGTIEVRVSLVREHGEWRITDYAW
jgi:hypothetical protein